AELKAHRHARHDADREREREHFYPEVVRVLPRLVSRGRVAQTEEQQKPSEAYRDRGEEDMKADVQRELDARQLGWVQPEHACLFSTGRRRRGSGAAYRAVLANALHRFDFVPRLTVLRNALYKGRLCHTTDTHDETVAGSRAAARLHRAARLCAV